MLLVIPITPLRIKEEIEVIKLCKALRIRCNSIGYPDCATQNKGRKIGKKNRLCKALIGVSLTGKRVGMRPN
jgi:hypothetical protein